MEYVPSQQFTQTACAKYRLTRNDLQGQIHLILTDGSRLSGAFALAEIVEALTPFKTAAKLLRTPQAEALYYWIASRRYVLFGCRDSCYVVPSRSRA